jgi:biotin-(acetyl-CoA carboxylase) ligase
VIPTQSDPTPATDVDTDARTVVEARRLVRRLATALVTAPFDEAAHAELQDFLANGAAEARAAWERLNALSDEELTAKARRAVVGAARAGGRK